MVFDNLRGCLSGVARLGICGPQSHILRRVQGCRSFQALLKSTGSLPIRRPLCWDRANSRWVIDWTCCRAHPSLVWLLRVNSRSFSYSNSCWVVGWCPLHRLHLKDHASYLSDADFDSGKNAVVRPRRALVSLCSVSELQYCQTLWLWITYSVAPFQLNFSCQQLACFSHSFQMRFELGHWGVPPTCPGWKLRNKRRAIMLQNVVLTLGCKRLIVHLVQQACLVEPL